MELRIHALIPMLFYLIPISKGSPVDINGLCDSHRRFHDFRYSKTIYNPAYRLPINS